MMIFAEGVIVLLILIVSVPSSTVCTHIPRSLHPRNHDTLVAMRCPARCASMFLLSRVSRRRRKTLSSGEDAIRQQNFLGSETYDWHARDTDAALTVPVCYKLKQLFRTPNVTHGKFLTMSVERVQKHVYDVFCILSTILLVGIMCCQLGCHSTNGWPVFYDPEYD